MYDKCLLLILIITLFVFTSCELLGDKPIEICCTKTDKLNMKLSLSNIPRNVAEYSLISSTCQDTNVIYQGKLSDGDTYKWITLNENVVRDQNYSIELRKADGSLCSVRDVFYLTTVCNTKSVGEKNRCVDPEKKCQIQIDFSNKCTEPPSVVIEIVSPSRYASKQINRQGTEDVQLNFEENEVFQILCYPDQGTNAYNVSWEHYYPRDAFYVNQQLTANTNSKLDLKLQRVDNETTVYCAGMGGKLSTKIFIKINKQGTESKEVQKVIFNEKNVVTHNCSKGHHLLSKKTTGQFIHYSNGTAKIHQEYNGSIFFCFTYRSSNDLNTYLVIREIYNQVMYIYEESTVKAQGADDIALWASVVTIAAVIVVAGLLLAWHQRRRIKRRPTESQEYVTISRVCPAEVEYAELDALPCTSGNSSTSQAAEEPYATIIGVLGENSLYSNTEILNGIKSVNMFATSADPELDALTRQEAQKPHCDLEA